MTIEERIKNTIRDVANFPQEGIVFKDLTTILLNPEYYDLITNEIIKNLPSKPDAVVGIESRGFWFGTLVARALNVSFIPLRKKGKLPGSTDEVSYDLEYGRATLEVHKDHIKPNWNVLIHDDLLATGGTAMAAADLVELQNAKVLGYSFIVCLNFLNGADKLKQKTNFVHSIVTYK